MNKKLKQMLEKIKNFKQSSKKVKIVTFSTLFVVFVGVVVLVLNGSTISSDASSKKVKNEKKEVTVEQSEKPLDVEETSEPETENEEAKETNEPEATEEVDEKEEQKLMTDATEAYAEIEKNDSIRKAYLTFDDGPSNNTKKILDILDKYDVKATFFVIHVPEHEEDYKEIVKRGHTIALHTYTHNYEKIYSSENAYFEDLDNISKYVEEVTGVKTHYMRFPGGSSNGISKHYCRGIMTSVTKSVEDKGYKYYDWNVCNNDAEEKCFVNGKTPVSTILSSVKGDVGNGSHDACVLMHDTDAKSTTVEALPQVIEFLKSKNYTMLPITDNTKEFHHGKLNN